MSHQDEPPPPPPPPPQHHQDHALTSRDDRGRDFPENIGEMKPERREIRHHSDSRLKGGLLPHPGTEREPLLKMERDDRIEAPPPPPPLSENDRPPHQFETFDYQHQSRPLGNSGDIAPPPGGSIEVFDYNHRSQQPPTMWGPPSQGVGPPPHGIVPPPPHGIGPPPPQGVPSFPPPDPRWGPPPIPPPRPELPPLMAYFDLPAGIIAALVPVSLISSNCALFHAYTCMHSLVNQAFSVSHAKIYTHTHTAPRTRLSGYQSQRCSSPTTTATHRTTSPSCGGILQ